jgi:hypothetical protein
VCVSVYLCMLFSLDAFVYYYYILIILFQINFEICLANVPIDCNVLLIILLLLLLVLFNTFNTIILLEQIKIKLTVCSRFFFFVVGRLD